MASNGWATFGSVLGGGIDRAGAYETGRLRAAQTETALAQARERQLAAVQKEAELAARERVREAEARSGMLGKQFAMDDLGLADLMESGYGNIDQVMGGRLKGQEYDFRSTLGDADAPLGDQFAAGQGVQGKVLPRYEVTGGVAEDLLGETDGLFATPVGEAGIAADKALENLRNVQAGDPDYQTASSGGGGAGSMPPPNIKPPPGGWPKLGVGDMYNPNYNADLPTTGDNYPIISARAPVAGSIEHRINQRMVRSAAQLVPDLSNLLTMPARSSLGVIGIGSVPGASMLQSSVDALRNTITTDVARAYASQSGEMGKAMAYIEANGQVPNQAAFEQAINAYAIREGDTGFDVLRKFANLRQNIEQFNLVQQADQRVPADIRALLAELTEKTRRSVPFTVEQVNQLQFGNDRRATMADLMRQHGFDPQPQSGAPAAQPGAPAAPQDDWIDLGNGVRVREKRAP